MRYLVTGGCGFIGSHLCERLLERSTFDEVLAVDNFYTGTKRNVSHFMHNYPARFEVMRHDVTFPLYVEVDRIFNLACPASPVHYQRDPVQTLKTCVHGAINMLGLAKRTGARILQASTSEVYGDPEEHPQRESYWGRVNPVGPRSCYDEGKRAAETLFSDYHRQHGVDVRIARIFNTYGPRMRRDDGRVISNFICQAQAGKPITVYGDGSQTRSFCYVEDLVDGLIRFMDFDEHPPGTRPNPKLRHLPFNFGRPEEFTILELAKLVCEKIPNSRGVAHEDLPRDDPRQRKPDIDRAKYWLGWEPTTPLAVGLQKTIEYFAHVP